MVYHAAMAAIDKPVRQSVSLPSRVARRVRAMARGTRTSASRVLVDLIEAGLATKDREKEHFLELAERLAQTKDPAEVEQLKKELARLTFGE